MSILNTRDAAALLGLSKFTLDQWRCRGEGPAFVKLGKAVRYRSEDVDAFIASQVRTSTSGAAPQQPQLKRRNK